MASGGDPAELQRFAALAERWWDETGPLAPLHKLNPVRLAYIRDRICLRFGRDPLADQPLAGLGALDVGCGGGLLCEPLARLGAAVTGIDRKASRSPAGTRASPVSRSATALRPPRNWSPSSVSSIWSAPWKWSSTSPIRRPFLTPARPWSGPAAASSSPL